MVRFNRLGRLEYLERQQLHYKQLKQHRPLVPRQCQQLIGLKVKWSATVLMSVINTFSAKDVLIDFTLSNARRFYSSKGKLLALKGLRN